MAHHDDDLAEAAVRAVRTAAEHLDIDPHTLADRLGDGEIAHLVMELRLLLELGHHEHDPRHARALLGRIRGERG